MAAKFRLLERGGLRRPGLPGGSARDAQPFKSSGTTLTMFKLQENDT
ncbi:MAG: hypothetical protein ACRYHC_10805 [Janthinobacterium lividum]